MTKGKLYVVVSMDCERIRAESYRNDGTISWEMSKLAITGLAELLHQEGMKGTFLPTPATAAKQAHLFHELSRQVFEIGMQFHCDSFRNGEYKQVLGSYDYDSQKEILTLAKADWEEALGMPMLTYRSGYFSANDFTFPILAELGVKQTSCSKPGRYSPGFTLWYSALPYAHQPSRSSRLQAGDLDIVEVPLSSHPGERFAMQPRFDPRDARPDSDFKPEVYHDIIDAVLWEMEMIDPKVKTFVILTHNTLDYTSDQEPRRSLMVDMLHYLKAKEQEGWQIVPATLADVRAAFLAQE